MAKLERKPGVTPKGEGKTSYVNGRKDPWKKRGKHIFNSKTEEPKGDRI